MVLLLGVGMNFLVYLVLGTIMYMLVNINPWFGFPILVLMILLTAFSGFIIANRSKSRKVRNALIVSIIFYILLTSAYNSGEFTPSYFDNLYAVQMIPVSLLGAFINFILQKK